jgi:hypothetical protein
LVDDILKAKAVAPVPSGGVWSIRLGTKQKWRFPKSDAPIRSKALPSIDAPPSLRRFLKWNRQTQQTRTVSAGPNIGFNLLPPVVCAPDKPWTGFQSFDDPVLDATQQHLMDSFCSSRKAFACDARFCPSRKAGEPGALQAI